MRNILIEWLTKPGDIKKAAEGKKSGHNRELETWFIVGLSSTTINQTWFKVAESNC
jgi:hypothetical protein